jgi:hypothetical protein
LLRYFCVFVRVYVLAERYKRGEEYLVSPVCVLQTIKVCRKARDTKYSRGLQPPTGLPVPTDRRDRSRQRRQDCLVRISIRSQFLFGWTTARA